MALKKKNAKKISRLFMRFNISVYFVPKFR